MRPPFAAQSIDSSGTAPHEIRAGRPRLERKVRLYRPLAVAVVGIGAYRVAFDRPRAPLGRQPEPLAGALLWVLPNTRGLNAHYQAAGFAEAFAELRDAVAGLRRQRSG